MYNPMKFGKSPVWGKIREKKKGEVLGPGLCFPGWDPEKKLEGTNKWKGNCPTTEAKKVKTG